jgi:hypothetical protein
MEQAGHTADPMGGTDRPSGFQLVIDCADPDLLTPFWAAAVG